MDNSYNNRNNSAVSGADSEVMEIIILYANYISSIHEVKDVRTYVYIISIDNVGARSRSPQLCHECTCGITSQTGFILWHIDIKCC